MSNNSGGKFRKKRTNFSMVSNDIIRNDSVSLKAKGLYALIQSYITIDNFTLYKGFLQSKCIEGERAFDSAWRELKEKGIHECIDSNGGIWNEEVEELFKLTDLVLLDIKEFNPARHQALTGRSNEQTIRTAAWLEENEKPFWLRYVLVPGYSDFEEDIRRLGEALGKYKMVQRVEILPYHTLGVHKYEAMEQEYKLKDVKENTPEQLEKAAEVFKEYFTTVVVN